MAAPPSTQGPHDHTALMGKMPISANLNVNPLLHKGWPPLHTSMKPKPPLTEGPPWWKAPAC